MACYHPMLFRWKGEYNPVKDPGAKPTKKYICIGSYAGPDEMDSFTDIVVPCGKCIGCRLDYSRRWADRMMLELETAGKGLFCTLTYNDDSIPCAFDPDTGEFLGHTVSKRDCQLFMKNLRRDFEPIRIRFYLSSEYGPLNHRPHYHCILFGIGLEDLPGKEFRKVNSLGQKFYRSPEIEKAWPHGFVLVSEVSWSTCSYVARYVLKKAVSDDLSGEELGVDPEFSLMSRRPGIGSEYLEMHPDVFDYQIISLPGRDGAKKIYLPKYYLRKLKLQDPDKFDKIKQERLKASRDKELLRMHDSTVSFLDQLEIDEIAKCRQLAALKRTVE